MLLLLHFWSKRLCLVFLRLLGCLDPVRASLASVVCNTLSKLTSQVSASQTSSLPRGSLGCWKSRGMGTFGVHLNGALVFWG